jgi:bifunctional enzyme CysN/CysC
MADDTTLLRIATAGSVDDGKSTLIGRLLHDTKTVFEDQLDAVARASTRYGDGTLNLALLTDGLRAEREQGITIDVAYRYFATPHRTFIVADTPGHTQYTRNMVTGASVSDVAVVLVDARKGLVEQSRRHAAIAALLGVSHIVLAVNKMDLVGWEEETFLVIAKEARELVESLPTPVPVTAVPVSALHGDNVVHRTDAAPWYEGPALLELLESLPVEADEHLGARLAVQWVIRSAPDYRASAGQLWGGSLAVGDEVMVLPSGQRSTVAGIQVGDVAVEVAHAGQPVAVQLAHDIDAGRGEVIVAASSLVAPTVTSEVDVDVCWMIDRPLTPGSRWTVKHLTKQVRAVVTSIDHRLDLTTLEHVDADALQLNDLGRVRLTLTAPIVADRYADQRVSGRLIIVDEATNTTAGAAMLR